MYVYTYVYTSWRIYVHNFKTMWYPSPQKWCLRYETILRYTLRLYWGVICRCLRNHFKCHILQIELNNWLLHMFQQSIKSSLITVNVEQLIYLFLTRFCFLPILLITLQRHPVHLEVRSILIKTDVVEGLGKDLVLKKKNWNQLVVPVCSVQNR